MISMSPLLARGKCQSVTFFFIIICGGWGGLISVLQTYIYGQFETRVRWFSSCQSSVWVVNIKWKMEGPAVSALHLANMCFRLTSLRNNRYLTIKDKGWWGASLIVCVIAGLQVSWRNETVTQGCYTYSQRHWQFSWIKLLQHSPVLIWLMVAVGNSFKRACLDHKLMKAEG